VFSEIQRITPYAVLSEIQQAYEEVCWIPVIQLTSSPLHAYTTLKRKNGAYLFQVQ
jgi:hypothetical protein